jgi:hypothetical protein
MVAIAVASVVVVDLVSQQWRRQQRQRAGKEGGEWD